MNDISPLFRSPTFSTKKDRFGVFLLVTVILGGGAATLAGRAIAATWRPWWQVVVYGLILAGAVRFFHFSLFGGTLLSLHYYLVEACLLRGLRIFRLPGGAHIADGLAISLAQRTAGPMRWRRKLP